MLYSAELRATKQEADIANAREVAEINKREIRVFHLMSQNKCPVRLRLKCSRDQEALPQRPRQISNQLVLSVVEVAAQAVLPHARHFCRL